MSEHKTLCQGDCLMARGQDKHNGITEGARS